MKILAKRSVDLPKCIQKQNERKLIKQLIKQKRACAFNEKIKQIRNILTGLLFKCAYGCLAMFGFLYLTSMVYVTLSGI